MDKSYIVNLQGRDFVLHAGLLAEFHATGGASITTDLIHADYPNQVFVFKATVVGDKGTFCAYGDASPLNVNSMIAKHVLRMAETRAVNRALRFYDNIGLCSVDELGGDDVDPARQVKDSGSSSTTKKNNAISIEQGDQLKSGERNGKKWYGLKKQNGSMTWLTEEQHEYLSNYTK